jgi:hypothetical protein
MIARKAQTGIGAVVLALGIGCQRPPAPPADLYVGASMRFDVAAQGDGAAVVAELSKYARLFGFPTVEAAESPVLLVTGTLSFVEGQPVTLEGTVIEHQWVLNADLTLADAKDGTVRERFALQDYKIGAADRDRARRTALRAGARRLGEAMFYEGAALGQPDVRDLLADLLIESAEGRLYNEIIERVVAMGLRAVPYLIWKMDDERRVALAGDLPGVTDQNAHRVAVCHVANYALERILGRQTALTVEADSAEVRRHLVGWQKVWIERCGAYRYGPERAAVLEEAAKRP